MSQQPMKNNRQQLHPEWLGVWQIRGNSRWNGSTMIAKQDQSGKYIIFDPKTPAESWNLVPDPEDKYRAYWYFGKDKRTGSSKRAYCGTIITPDYNLIEWSDVKRRKKVDDWIRSQLSESQVMQRSAKQHTSLPSVVPNPAAVARKSAHNHHKSPHPTSAAPSSTQSTSMHRSQPITSMQRLPPTHQSSSRHRHHHNEPPFGAPKPRKAQSNTQGSAKSAFYDNTYYEPEQTDRDLDRNPPQRRRVAPTFSPHQPPLQPPQYRLVDPRSQQSGSPFIAPRHHPRNAPEPMLSDPAICGVGQTIPNHSLPTSKPPQWITSTPPRMSKNTQQRRPQYTSPPKPGPTPPEIKDADYLRTELPNVESKTKRMEIISEVLYPYIQRIVSHRSGIVTAHLVEESSSAEAVRLLENPTQLRDRALEISTRLHSEAVRQQKESAMRREHDANNLYTDHHNKNRRRRVADAIQQSRPRNIRYAEKRGQSNSARRENRYAIPDRRRDNRTNRRDRDRDRMSQRENQFRERRVVYAPHLSEKELEMAQENGLVFVGEINISRWNPSLAYVAIDGLTKDPKILGLYDRNRAMHGDKVVISLYPTSEWVAAETEEMLEFQKKVLKLEREDQSEDEDDDEDAEEALLALETDVEDDDEEEDVEEADVEDEDEEDDDMDMDEEAMIKAEASPVTEEDEDEELEAKPITPTSSDSGSAPSTSIALSKEPQFYEPKLETILQGMSLKTGALSDGDEEANAGMASDTDGIPRHIQGIMQAKQQAAQDDTGSLPSVSVMSDASGLTMQTERISKLDQKSVSGVTIEESVTERTATPPVPESFAADIPSQNDKSSKSKPEPEQRQPRRQRMMLDLNDPNSVTAVEHFFERKRREEYRKRLEELTNDTHGSPARNPAPPQPLPAILSAVLEEEKVKKAVQVASESTADEKKEDGSDYIHPNKQPKSIARGKVVAILGRRKMLDRICGYISPLYRNNGMTRRLDWKWASFVPLDKRMPKALFPLFKEMPLELEKLLQEHEKAEKQHEQGLAQERMLREDKPKMVYRPKPKTGDKDKTNNSSGDDEKQVVSDPPPAPQPAQAQPQPWKRWVNPIDDELRNFIIQMKYEAGWNQFQKHPTCHYVKILGARGDPDHETDIILSNHNIRHTKEFEPDVEAFVKDMKISEEDYVGRRDIRHIPVFTIDPTTARDFDDALSIEYLDDRDEDGKKLYRVGIHIADVTHFVKPGTPVDDEARRRATSVYLVDRCLPMLPHHLCQNLCSLNPDVDRLAYSVFVDLNEDGVIIEHDQSPWFGRTVIRSRARLNYETAHWILEDKVTADTPMSELPPCVSLSDNITMTDVIKYTKQFWVLAKKRRDRRFRGGSVAFFRPRIRFRLDASGKRALVFGPEIMLKSNNLIEEMMLMANQLVAAQLVKVVRPLALLRRHPQPDLERAKRLLLIARAHKMKIDFSSSKAFNTSLEKLDKVSFSGVSGIEIMNNLVTGPMMRAQYIPVEETDPKFWSHWALNFPVYTHFTSPIRRYADVLVHRLLTHTIDMNEPIAKAEIPEALELSNLCKVCNAMNENAGKAEMDSQRIHLCIILQHRPLTADAIIADMFKAFFEVILPGLGMTQSVRLEGIVGGKATLVGKLPNSELHIEWDTGEKEEYKLFDRIRVRLSSKVRTPIKLETTVVHPSDRKEMTPFSVSQKLESPDKEKSAEAKKALDNTPVAFSLERQLSVGTEDFSFHPID